MVRAEANGFLCGAGKVDGGMVPVRRGVWRRGRPVRAVLSAPDSPARTGNELFCSLLLTRARRFATAILEAGVRMARKGLTEAGQPVCLRLMCCVARGSRRGTRCPVTFRRTSCAPQCSLFCSWLPTGVLPWMFWFVHRSTRRRRRLCMRPRAFMPRRRRPDWLALHLG